LRLEAKAGKKPAILLKEVMTGLILILIISLRIRELILIQKISGSGGRGHPKNKKVDNVYTYILRCLLRSYNWVVPFLIDEQERIVLKTAFPSCKYHKLYGGSN